MQWIQNKIQLITIRNEIQDEKTEGHHDQKIDGEQHQEETENWATRKKSEKMRNTTKTETRRTEPENRKNENREVNSTWKSGKLDEPDNRNKERLENWKNEELNAHSPLPLNENQDDGVDLRIETGGQWEQSRWWWCGALRTEGTCTHQDERACPGLENLILLPRDCSQNRKTDEENGKTREETENWRHPTIETAYLHSQQG